MHDLEYNTPSRWSIFGHLTNTAAWDLGETVHFLYKKNTSLWAGTWVKPVCMTAGCLPTNPGASEHISTTVCNFPSSGCTCWADSKVSMSPGPCLNLNMASEPSLALWISRTLLSHGQGPTDVWSSQSLPHFCKNKLRTRTYVCRWNTPTSEERKRINKGGITLRSNRWLLNSVAITQGIHMLKHYIIHLKLMQYCMPTILK